MTEYIVPIIRWVICSLWRFIRRAKIGSERDTSVKNNRRIAQIWPFMPIYVKGKLILNSESKFVFDLNLWGKIIACYVPNCTMWFRSLLQCTNFVKQNKHSLKLFIFSSYQIKDFGDHNALKHFFPQKVATFTKLSKKLPVYFLPKKGWNKWFKSALKL